MLAGGADAVDGDDPRAAGRRDVPGGQFAELAGDPHLAEGQAERAAGVAAVHLGREADLVAGGEDAVVDTFQPAHDGVGGLVGPVDHGADDGVDVLAGQPVRAGAQRGEGPGQGDLPGGRRVDGEFAVGGERSAGRRLEGDVAGEPAGRDRCRAGADECGDGRCRRGNRAHTLSVGVRSPRCQWAGPSGPVRAPYGPPQRCPYPFRASRTSPSWSSDSRAGVRPGTALAVSQTRQSHSSWAVRSYASSRAAP